MKDSIKDKITLYQTFMFTPKITKETINSLPIIHFEGEISIIDDALKVGPAIEALRKHSIVGIDTETKPTFAKGRRNKISLIQISTLEHCYLFRLNHIDFPKPLIDFLTDDKIKKIGLALRDDMNGLNRHRKFKPSNTVDLQNIVKSYGIMELGLQKIYAIVFGQKISKSQQLSNWENHELTEQQQRYAATDAWACLRVYLKLQKEKILTEKEIEQLSIVNDANQ